MSARTQGFRLVSFTVAVLVLGLAATTAHADTIHVCWDGSGDYVTIQEGIDAASDGDEVVVCDGTYTGPGNRDLDFDGKLITVRSENGPDDCIIDCEEDGRGFYLHSGETEVAVIAGFTITNGHALSGGGIFTFESSPTIRGCVITSNSASWDGGGMSCNRGTVTVVDSQITANTAGRHGGGFFCDHADVVIQECEILSNGADYDGGGVYCFWYTSVSVNMCTIAGNWAKHAGGISGGDLIITDSVIADNAALYGAGVICGVNSILSDCLVTRNNAAAQGGGVRAGQGSQISGCTISWNTAAQRGGGIYIDNVQFDGPTITACEIHDNQADYGGGIGSANSVATISDCVITRNTAFQRGGGINQDSALRIRRCAIVDNLAGGDGGGIYSRGSGAVVSCVIAANRSNRGAGVFCWLGEPTIVNCTITGNSGSVGGGLYVDDIEATITNCTVVANSATFGRALACDSYGHNNPSTVRAMDCILRNGRDEVYNNDNSTITLTYSNVQGGWPGAGNIDADPLFVDPDGADDDPNTWEDNDYHLSPGSPCIDSGCNGGVPPDTADLDEDADTAEITPFDLDGEGRFFDDPNTPDTGCGCPPIVDMGAYEFGDSGPQPCPGDLDCDRVVGHSDLGILLAAWEQCTNGDLDCDGDTDQADLGILLAHWGEGCP